MTDAFLCDGCEEYRPASRRFVGLEMDKDRIGSSDYTLDDIPTAAYKLFDTRGSHDHPKEGDYCFKCGMEMLELLVEWREEQPADE
jgi:hypothetical protein